MSADKQRGSGFYPQIEVNPGRGGCVLIELTDPAESERGDIGVLTEQEARDMAMYILKTFPAKEPSQ